MREEVGLKISVDDVLGRAEGRNRAEGVLEKAAKSADASAEIVPAQFVDRAEIPDRLRLIRLMALRIQTQYPNDLDIVPALATVKPTWRRDSVGFCLTSSTKTAGRSRSPS